MGSAGMSLAAEGFEVDPANLSPGESCAAFQPPARLRINCVEVNAKAVA